MARIKVSELKNTIKSMDIPKTNTTNFIDLSFEVRNYLTISEKIQLVKNIHESAIDREGGLHILDKNSLDIAFKVLLAQTYAPNITLPKNIVESYDLLCSSGLYDAIYDSIPENEMFALRDALNNLIEVEKDEYEQKNTIQFIIKDLLNGLINKMPDEEGMKKLIEDAKNTVEGFDPSKMEYINEFMKLNRGE